MTRIGIIGTGGMAHAHAENFSTIKGVELAACCDISHQRAEAFAQKWQVPAVYTDYGDMLENERLDGVAIVTADAVHAAIAVAALKRCIPVLCEKPMAATLAQGRTMAAAARKAGVPAMVNFTKRNSPGLEGARRCIAAGEIGRIIHVEASYLQEWCGTVEWKRVKADSGTVWRVSSAGGNVGVLSDLGCHLYDMAVLLCGPFAEISCRLATFDKGVKRIGPFPLDACDSFVTTVRFANGALGEIHSTRWAAGYGNREFIRVSGDKGTVEVDLAADFNAYRRYTHKTREWKTIACKSVPSTWARFVRAVRSGKRDPCDFANGLAIQSYLQTSVRSHALGRPLKVGVEAMMSAAET